MFSWPAWSGEFIDFQIFVYEILRLDLATILFFEYFRSPIKIEKPGNPSTNHPRGKVFEQHRHVGSITDNTADAESKIKKFRLLKGD